VQARKQEAADDRRLLDPERTVRQAGDEDFPLGDHAFEVESGFLAEAVSERGVDDESENLVDRRKRAVALLPLGHMVLKRVGPEVAHHRVIDLAQNLPAVARAREDVVEAEKGGTGSFKKRRDRREDEHLDVGRASQLPHALERVDDRGRDEGATIFGNIVENVEPDRELRRVEVDHVPPALGRDEFQKVLAVLAVRVEEEASEAAPDVLDDPVLERRRFARPARAEDIDVAQALGIVDLVERVRRPLAATIMSRVGAELHEPRPATHRNVPGA
jgi:hypothetical protein